MISHGESLALSGVANPACDIGKMFRGRILHPSLEVIVGKYPFASTFNSGALDLLMSCGWIEGRKPFQDLPV